MLASLAFGANKKKSISGPKNKICVQISKSSLSVSPGPPCRRPTVELEGWKAEEGGGCPWSWCWWWYFSSARASIQSILGGWSRRTQNAKCKRCKLQNVEGGCSWLWWFFSSGRASIPSILGGWSSPTSISICQTPLLVKLMVAQPYTFWPQSFPSFK